MVEFGNGFLQKRKQSCSPLTTRHSVAGHWVSWQRFHVCDDETAGWMQNLWERACSRKRFNIQHGCRL